MVVILMIALGAGLNPPIRGSIVVCANKDGEPNGLNPPIRGSIGQMTREVEFLFRESQSPYKGFNSIFAS